MSRLGAACAALAVVFGLLHGNHVDAAGCKVYKARWGQCGGKKGLDAPFPGYCCKAGLVCKRMHVRFWRCELKPVPKRPSPAPRGCRVYKARWGQCGGKKGLDAPFPGYCCKAGLVCKRLHARFWRCDLKPVPRRPSPKRSPKRSPKPSPKPSPRPSPKPSPSPSPGYPKPRAPYNYSELIEKSLLFYEAQRSGALPPSNRIPWRADSFTHDVAPDGTIIQGGWFDAGDHVKFVFPAAWTLTVLAWEIIEFGQGFAKSRQLPYALDNLRWGANFLMHCRLGENITIAQIGNGGADHVAWNRPENITTPYPVYTLNATAPGSDLTGTMAAALAAVSIVFNTSDPVYSAKCLSHARRLYKFSKTYLGKYSTSVPEAAAFYPSFSFYDDIAWGAIFLHLATGETSYRTEAALYLDKSVELEGALFTGWLNFGYDNAAWGACLLLAKVTGNETYIARMHGFYSSWIQGTTDKPTYTPLGFAWFAQWGSAQATMNTVFLMAVYTKSDFASRGQRLRLTCFAHKMAGYILGDTGRSFVVGYGVNPPCRYHHRGASCGNITQPCSWDDYVKPTCNPHVLTGALVGGPLKDDSYVDVRHDYVQNEVAINYNAGFTGVMAFLVEATITRAQCDRHGLSSFPYLGSVF